MIKVFYIIAGLSVMPFVNAQEDLTNEIAKIVFLDSVVIKASKIEFSVTDFIDLVRQDATFYHAFRNLRTGSYDFDTEMFFFDRNKKEKATYQATYRQYFVNQCRFQTKKNESFSGDFFRKKRSEANFYTFELFDRLFIEHDTVCNIKVVSPDFSFEGVDQKGHISELKKLIFAPGTRSDVPLLGNKTEIFSDKMMERYDFYIHSESYFEYKDTYVFKVKLKPEFEGERNNKTVIKELTTYFSKKDFQVLGRSYRLAQYKALFQFDVSINIRLQRKEDRYYPAMISFDGFWNVPMKRKETSTFVVEFYGVD